MKQIAIPVQPSFEAIAQKKTLGKALEYCAELAGFDLDKELSIKLGVDKGQFSRWQSGGEGIKWDKFEALMDACGNDAPLLWMLHARGYDLHSIRRTETETEKRLRLSEEENAALKRLFLGKAA